MPRGGKRNGTPGKSYPNRTDLNQGIKTVPGQTYGQAGAQAAAQSVVPLPQSPSPQPQAQAAPFAPPEPGMLGVPTTKPGEPVTSGLPVGAGAGPDILGPYGQNDQILANLRAAYQADPTPGLAELIIRVEQSRAAH